MFWWTSVENVGCGSSAPFPVCHCSRKVMFWGGFSPLYVGWMVFWMFCLFHFVLVLILYVVPCFWGGGVKKIGGWGGEHACMCVCVCGRERENACIHVSAYACVPASVCLVQVTHPTQNSSDIAVWSWQVGDLDVVLVPVSMTVIGCPLNFQMTAANPDQSTVLR